ncbi:unnamed protein product [Paramecium octaurelia]|uniref:Calpain catalytic domain-containing protein n=1 Tax=Paramecium octaurelia TaxID=43137 RepID=A0A8S1VB77_PAROT|nr:unnamed protein product [Paramecium octaurelia]
MIDQEFPPTIENVGKKKTLSWKAFNDFPLFVEQSSQFPKQGKLGNCYWIAPLVAVYAAKPQQIKSLFQSHDSDFTTVRFCIDGDWQEITVDHHFPYNEEKQKVAYSKLVDGALWAMILEKAWAKLYGSYQQICAGFNRTTFKVLTGAPTNKFRTRDPNFKEIIYEIGALHFPVGANSKKQQIDNVFATNHAYSILKIDEDQIIVRNPWGIKNRDQHTLTFEEFKLRFASIECCYHFDGYQYQSEKVTSDVLEPVYFEIEIKAPGNYFFTVNQKNKRWFRNKPHLKYVISPCQIQIIYGDTILNQQQHQSNKEVWINWNFKRPCKIYIICQIEWQNIVVNEFIFNTYGPDFNQKRVQEIIKSNEDINDLGYIQFLQRDSEKEQEEEEKSNQIQQVEIQQQENEQVISPPPQQKERKSCGQCTIY